MSGGLTEQGIIDYVRGVTGGSASGVRVGIGDDCAVLEVAAGTRLLATTDLLLEDVHFRRRYMEPADLGWKALAVNLSDIAAMGGKPRWALVALACPPSTGADEVEAFYAGLLALATPYEVAVAGGDTSSSPAGWIINVSLLGEARRPILRSTACEGDMIAVTGPLGRSAAGLAVLEGGVAPASLDSQLLVDVTGAHRRPDPRVREGAWLADSGAVTAMIDLSDGLAVDLAHVCRESRLGARVDVATLPVNAATREVARVLDADAVRWATGGGEDYELLLTCRPERFEALRDGLARATGTRLHPVGTMTTPGTGMRFVDAGGREVSVAPGFQHFAGERRR